MLWELLWEHKGKLLGVAAGLFFGIIYLFVGFWDTLVIVVFVGTGYYIGRKLDHKEDLREILDRILPGKFR
ncbi:MULTISPECIES: DUF2273 domain-containing protein [Bacillales]|jgi:uncharacterized membrane protein|uniref:DUF2273 domain-containing protein n=1 Tax=Brevibacillus aydinogluensis TaxID=927786 RepID=A0AA48M814_9BACL|nr:MULTISPECIES: DUF2273 domain-containing protein [Bacillales]REK62452.1 MAG: hypothetical protein DF221_13725 [Brevibacillus sp.]MBR8659213.1 DUF2273 domain-containing protein [Brevibacillus sp. NL20B1]NNV02743.1 DUF2273 domain-containing protein [Brevibacillus sp. MCWH]UFJ63115.1 DUF2273 domain-containing protein [Anoxybacillus sediminis]CAJ1002981.1 DUF2273 domain-containing protein [Brevibacillus aydinogluensis]